MTRIRLRQFVAVAVVAGIASCRAGNELPAGAYARAVEPGAVCVGGPVRFSELTGLDSLGLATVLDLDREHLAGPNGRVAPDWEIARAAEEACTITAAIRGAVTISVDVRAV